MSKDAAEASESRRHLKVFRVFRTDWWQEEEEEEKAEGSLIRAAQSRKRCTAVRKPDIPAGQQTYPRSDEASFVIPVNVDGLEEGLPVDGWTSLQVIPPGGSGRGLEDWIGFEG